MLFFNELLSIIMSPLGILSIGALICIAILVSWIIRLELRLKKILLGKGENIEQSLTHLAHGHHEFKNFKKDIETYLTDVEKRLQRSIQSVETIRFNAYDGIGANQSFTTVFLNEKGDGVVVSSLYARERTSVFSKPIKNHTSEFGLIEEEVQALQKARIRK